MIKRIEMTRNEGSYNFHTATPGGRSVVPKKAAAFKKNNKLKVVFR